MSCGCDVVWYRKTFRFQLDYPIVASKVPQQLLLWIFHINYMYMSYLEGGLSFEAGAVIEK